MFSILDITKDIPNCEFSAICLSSAVNLEKFIDVYISKNIQADTRLIIVLDNDKNPNDSIKQAIQKGLSMAKKHKIPYAIADVKKLYLNQKDINDLCTKVTPVDCTKPLNPQAVKRWNDFINEIMCNDAEMVKFIQRLFEYTLEVSNREECFTILYGNTTRNGKSILLESISGTLVDYSRTVSSATLSEKATGKDANLKILVLAGAKLITCEELNLEILLNNTLLKAISGRDSI